MLVSRGVIKSIVYVKFLQIFHQFDEVDPIQVLRVQADKQVCVRRHPEEKTKKQFF